jgi:hypothetical protein
MQRQISDISSPHRQEMSAASENTIAPDSTSSPSKEQASAPTVHGPTPEAPASTANGNDVAEKETPFEEFDVCESTRFEIAENVISRLEFLMNKKFTVLNDAEVEVIPRKVIMLAGKSGSGKTTMFNTLLDKDYEAKLSKILSDTVTPVVGDIQLTRYDKQGNESKVHLTVLDTPGLFERRTHLSQERNNEILMRSIADAILKDLVEINMIMICHRHRGIITNEDIEAMEAIMDFVGEDGKENCGLLLTGCELREASIESFVNELRSTEACKRIAEFIGNRIYAMGANDYDIRQNHFKNRTTRTEGTYHDMLSSVHRLRSKMIDSIFSLPNPVRTSRIREVKIMLQAERENFVKVLIENQKNDRTANNAVAGAGPQKTMQQKAGSGKCFII